MSPDVARRYIDSLYKNLFKRTPNEVELEHWVSAVQQRGPDNVYFSFINSPEYIEKARVRSLFPLGHFYSPVVDPATVSDYVKDSRKTEFDKIGGIEVPLQAMVDFWVASAAIISRTPFHEEPSEHFSVFIIITTFFLMEVQFRFVLF